jgi:hypothetical protein
MSQFNYVGSGNPAFGGPAAAPALYLDKANRVIWVWDGVTGIWIPEIGTNVSLDAIAAAGANQAAATVLPMATAYNVTSSGGANNGVVLPASWTGAEIAVNNLSGGTITVYPKGTETINALAASAGLAGIASGTITILYCFTAGKWYSK